MTPRDTPHVPTADSQVTRDTGDRVAGEQIGPYHLLQKIGEGGMGEVWVAAQREPIRRTVAVKVIKAGMETRQVVARFEAERQALAVMDHPGIAKVLDAGATAGGRAYFVMEYVRGDPITTYCDRERLSTAERLELFTRVCDAVQHAHQKGIIHRDLKPSNVLVAIQDGHAVPKIIDFGIAKATAQRLTERTLFTELGVLIGTPEYMSPEQAEMSGVDIDTRTDVYSLGVVLYQLLTGALPFDAKSLRQAGLDGVRRHIREVDPPRPSTKVSTERDASSEAARSRRTDPARLATQLKGDLDWITMKCLEKDRTRRYASASELAADISRHLRDKPVEAHAPGRVYRLRKLVRRNRPVFAAAAVVFLALTTALGASLWSLRTATREAARSQQVADFLQEMLRGVRPSVALGRDTTMLREILDKTAARLDNELRDQPQVQADLRHTIGGVYLDLGQYTAAESMFRKAFTLRQRTLGDRHPDTATSLNSVGDALRQQSRFAEAEHVFRDALAIRQRALGPDHPDVAGSLNALGVALAQQGKLRDGEAEFREALAMQKRLAGSEHRDVATTLNNLGNVLRDQGRFEESEAVFREALSIRQKLLGPAHPDLAVSLSNLALVLNDRGNSADAEALQRQALEMKKKLLGREHPEVANSMMLAANLLQAQGKWADAEALQREALAIKKKMLGPDHLEVARSLTNLGQVVSSQGRQVEAETLFRQALGIKEMRLGAQHPGVANTLESLAAVLEAEHKFSEAEAMVRKALAIERAALGNDHPGVAFTENNLAIVLREEGKLSEAASLHREAVAITERGLGGEHPDLALALSDLATTLLLDGKLAEAETAARRSLAIREKNSPDTWETFQARTVLGGTLARQRKYADAEPLLVTGYNGMRAREENMPESEKGSLETALKHLVDLSLAMGHPAQAAKWRDELRSVASPKTELTDRPE